MSQVSSGALQQRRKNAKEIQVTIIGLNRLSASFGLALRDLSDKPNASIIFTIQGFDTSTEKMKLAQSIGAIHTYGKTLAEVIPQADIVVYAAPMGQQASYFENMSSLLSGGTVVVDFSPLKSPGVKFAEEHFPRSSDGKLEVYLVGATPLIRFENVYEDVEEIGTAKADLFTKNNMLIAPSAKTPPEAVRVVNDLADFLDMPPRFLDPTEHDALAGFNEEIPVLMSLLYFHTLQESQGKVDLLRSANSRFAYMMQNLHGQTVDDIATMWQWNKDAMLQHIEQLAVALENVREVMMDKDPMVLEVFIEQVLDGFTEWEIRRRDNRWEEDIPDAPNIQSVGIAGSMMNKFLNLSRRKDDNKN